MTALDSVPLDRIGGGVKKTDYRKVAALILAGVLYVAGWLPGRTWLGVRIVATWAAHTWAGSALRVGWVDGYHYQPRRGR